MILVVFFHELHCIVGIFVRGFVFDVNIFYVPSGSSVLIFLFNSFTEIHCAKILKRYQIFGVKTSRKLCVNEKTGQVLEVNVNYDHGRDANTIACLTRNFKAHFCSGTSDVFA